MNEAVSKQSRTVIRLPEEIYTAINELAVAHNRSLNGEIVTSVHKFLYERESLTLIKDRLFATSPSNIMELNKRTPSFPFLATNTNAHQVTLRLDATVTDDLREALEIVREQNGMSLSLNSYLLQVMSWWITYNFQIQEFSKILYDDFKTSLRRPVSAVCGNLFGHSLAFA